MRYNRKNQTNKNVAENYFLSIIIPIYNLEKYINKCLDSIISQTNKNVEIILIDDGSNDNSKKICQEYSERYDYIKYYYQENSGVSVARNNGLKKSTGKYILFIDGDDWILEDAIENIINKLEASKDIDILAGSFIKEFNENRPKISISGRIQDVNIDEPMSIAKLLQKKLFNPALWCNVFKKELFTKNNICLDTDVKYTEDMDCTLKLYMKAKKIVVLEKPFYVYRQAREGAATNKINRKRVTDTFNFVVKWNEKIKENTFDEETKKYLGFFIQYQYSIVVGLLFALKKEEKKELYLKVKDYKHLLLKGNGKKGKLVHCTYKIFGFDILGKLLCIWIKNKNKIGR